MLQMISVKLRIIREFYVVKAHSDFDEDVLEILIHYRYITDTWQKTEKETKNKTVRFTYSSNNTSSWFIQK